MLFSWLENGEKFKKKKQKHILCLGHKFCVRNKCCAREQTLKHLCPQQYVHICHDFHLKAGGGEFERDFRAKRTKRCKEAILNPTGIISHVWRIRRKWRFSCRGNVSVCGITLLANFSCGILVILITSCWIRFLIALVHDSQCEKLALQVFPAILVFLVENSLILYSKRDRKMVPQSTVSVFSLQLEVVS